jgi:hypothetical protein
LLLFLAFVLLAGVSARGGAGGVGGFGGLWLLLGGFLRARAPDGGAFLLAFVFVFEARAGFAPLAEFFSSSMFVRQIILSSLLIWARSALFSVATLFVMTLSILLLSMDFSRAIASAASFVKVVLKKECWVESRRTAFSFSFIMRSLLNQQPTMVSNMTLVSLEIASA